MNIQERDFKGVWIPKEIWLNTNLTILEKCIFIEIDSLDNENHCIAGNEYFAEFCNCSESKVSKAIKKLCDLNMIEILEFNGRTRKIRVVKSTRQPSKKYEAASYKVLPININNNTTSKKVFLSKDKNTSQKLIELYHTHCYNLPKVRGIPDKRERAINNLIKKHPMDEIITVFDLANSSDFLIGNNDRGWKANIDFILREDKFINILEGKYNGKRRSTSDATTTETGARRVPVFTKEDENKLEQFQENLKKDGKRIYF